MAGMSEEEFLKRRQARKAAKEQGNKQKSDDAVSEPSPVDEDAEEIDEPVKPAKKQAEEIDEPVRTARKKVEEIEAPAEPSKKGKWIIALVAILLVAGGGAGGFVYYKSMIADTLKQIVDIEQKIVKSYPDCSAIGELKAENAALYRYDAIGDTYEATSSSIGDYQKQLGKLTTAEKSCAVEHEKRLEQAKADEDRKKRDEQIAALEAQKREAEARAMRAQVEAENAQKQAEAERQMRLATENEARESAQARAMGNADNRLTPVRAVKFPKKKYFSWLIMHDNLLDKPCHIITNSKYPIMQMNRWCIPFSGSDSDLSDTFAASVAMDYVDRKICKTGSSKQPSNGQTREAYCNQMFNALEAQAKRENWASFATICKTTTDAKLREYCDYLF